ncbi:DUF2407 C-terminal domain-containing protein [Apodospora peruviana]|uniref:DUF2407 C-terminal domain-containing protein n=1 Tax=Apodospora peruviana TaxID=516989 RepID=A0AAE0HXC7_9PEZI|nr:DUF2407 C-terminal domain-containing protein [Apodospora peruviana]
MSSNGNNRGGDGSNRSGSSSSSSPTGSTRPLLSPSVPQPQPTATGLAPPSPLRPPLSRNPSSSSLFNTIPPLHLTVRFSASLPDLELDILNPHRTTVVALKHLIRGRLAADASSSSSSTAARGRLRFIHAGRILPDAAALSTVLRALPPPPPTSQSSHSSHNNGGQDPKGKGKSVEGRGSASALRVYVNCSIGDELSDKELAEEAAAAAIELPSSPSSQPLPALASRGTSPRPGLRLNTNTPEGPRGFDRLLQAGFTPAEVNTLRLQFRSIQAQRHTPDTMPSPDTMRRMEDNWMDNNNTAPGLTSGGGGGDGDETTAGVGEEANGLAGQVDVLICGMAIGFFFPLAAFGWLLREEGIWSKRMQVFVSLGALLSLSLGIVRTLTVDG